jgi:hypothetical protein
LNPVIEIIVDPQGRTRIETKGFSGAACREASRFLERTLGHAHAEQLKPEFYQSQATEQQALRQQG